MKSKIVALISALLLLIMTLCVRYCSPKEAELAADIILAVAASTLILAAADCKWQAAATSDLLLQQSQQTQDHQALPVLQAME